MAPSLLSALLLAVWTSSGRLVAFAQEDMQDGCVHMQIIHSNNERYMGKRAVEFNLANRSDVAYYAKCEQISWAFFFSGEGGEERRVGSLTQ